MLAGLTFLLVAMVVLGGRRHEPSWRPDKSGWSEARRKTPSEWFMLQRTWPQERLNRDAVEQARTQAMEMRRDSRPSLDEDWIFAGPTNVGGRITALAVHPSAPDTVYAGAALGGVFKSTDGGLSYTNVFNDDFALSTGALAIDPQHPTWIWLGTGEANTSGDSYGGKGVYFSSDGGRNWAHKGLEEVVHIGEIAVDPENSDRVFVAAAGELFGTNPERGIYRTLDGGDTWSRVLFLTDSTAGIDVAVNPNNADTVYAVLWERIRTTTYRSVGGFSSGVWRSVNGGDTWSELTTGLPQTNIVGRGGIAVSPVNPNRLYLVYANHPGNLLGIYRSDNAGNSWTQTSGPGNGLYSNFGWYFGQIWAHPTQQNTVIVQGVNMYRSTNSGGAWSAIFSDAHVDHHALWIKPSDPTRMITGHDGGINVSTNSGANSTHASDLPITQFYAITSDPQLPQRLFGGTQDNSTPCTFTGNTDDWEVLYGGDGFYCLVDPRDSDVIFAEYQYGGLGKSTDGGQTFDYIASNFDNDRINWMMPFVMSPTNPDVLYCGTTTVWKTTTGGNDWTSISPDLTGGPGPGNLIFGTITTLSVSAADSQVVYAGTDDARVWRTQNGGANWQLVNAGLPQRWCTRVTAHYDSANVVYAAFSGYKWMDYMPHLFRSSDYGTIWQDISSNLPEAPVNDILIDPDQPSYLYAGTDFGVYFSADWGTTWSVLGDGLPLSSVFDLQVTTGAPRYLVAGTHGRSMWKIPLPTATVPAPAGLVIRPNGSVIRWWAVASALSYNVYGATHPDSVGSLLASGVTDTTWTDPLFGSRPAKFIYHVTAVR